MLIIVLVIAFFFFAAVGVLLKGLLLGAAISAVGVVVLTLISCTPRYLDVEEKDPDPYIPSRGPFVDDDEDK